MPVAAQDRGQVEAESVDRPFGDPVAQAVEQEIADHRMLAAERVAASAVIQVAAPFVEHVEERVVDAPEIVGRAVVAPLGGVVEDHVQVNLDAGLMKRVDHVAEFLPWARLLKIVGVGRLGSAEEDRVVSPEVFQFLAGERIDEGTVVFVELVDRQQLDGRDSQVLELIDLLHEPGIGSGVFHARAGVDRVAAHVQLVNDGVFQGRTRIDDALAVDHRLGHQAAARQGAPFAPGRPHESARAAGSIRMIWGS